ncbi:NfeD family protein [Maridesulfovibrio sp. FT414]|uniref:NfeD family protein n=1 Tax=Maridesulfovibrio sp. FT414 TaxID=2979469 RepID=UPI003D80931C
MGSYPMWLIWLVSGLVLAGLELLVPGMVLIFFSFGCFAAALVSAFVADGLVIQVAVFCAASVFSLVVLRKAFMNWFQGQTSVKEAEGYDDFPAGAIAEATRDFPDSGYGQIKYRGSFWNALAESGQIITAGDVVRIVSWVDKSKTAFLVTKN